MFFRICQWLGSEELYCLTFQENNHHAVWREMYMHEKATEKHLVLEQLPPRAARQFIICVIYSLFQKVLLLQQ